MGTLIADQPIIQSNKERSLLADSINQKLKGRSYSISPAEGDSQGSFKLESSKGPIDIVKNYKWTNSQFKEEVPRIHLVEYQITQNQQLAFLSNIVRGFSFGDALKGLKNSIPNTFGSILSNSQTNKVTLKDPYEGLYNAERTPFEYIFPYYSNNTAAIRSQWSSKVPAAGESLIVAGVKAAGGALAGLGLDKIGVSDGTRKTIESLANGFGVNIAGAVEDINAPFVGIEQPMYYNGTAKGSYSIKFPLFNTISLEDTKNNYDFVRIFAYQNLHLRSTLATYQPPVFYKCIQDEYRSELGAKPALYVSNYVVQNAGAVKAINLGDGYRVSIPEAYIVEITLSEMITTSRNIYSSIFTGNSISVTSINKPNTPRVAPEYSPTKSPMVPSLGGADMFL